MEEATLCRILKVVSPFHFLVQDQQDSSTLKIELKPTNSKSFEHLLPEIARKPLQYSLEKKSSKMREEYRRGALFLEGRELTSLYRSAAAREYASGEVGPHSQLECFVSKVECLKLELLDLGSLKHVTFYFSELKLVRIANVHPKEMWERAQSYFREQLEGEFVQLAVSGSEHYKEEVNLYGEVRRRRDGVVVEEKMIADGYAEPSKNAEKYLTKEKIELYNGLREAARTKSMGMWETCKNIGKSNLQAQEFKYKQWEEWTKEGRKVTALRNEEEELRSITEELAKVCQSGAKIEYSKAKVILDAVTVLFEDGLAKRHFRFFEEAIRIVCGLLGNLYLTVSQHVDNLDFIKALNKLLIFLTFYHAELEKYVEANRGEKVAKVGEAEFEKAVRLVFKLCFLGNETFHDKIFGKRKDCDYENFNFETAYLQGGFSSLSECSDYEDADKLSRQEKRERKLASAHQKIRINATALLAALFRHYGRLADAHWEMCVSSNVISPEFLAHVKRLRLTAEEARMSAEGRQEVVNLMRSNFGDHSLILLSTFERNGRVRANSVACLLNMIANFEGKRLIAAAERAYVERLLSSTRSSFVPKSFIVFSGLRNALYFLLFALYHEKNLQTIVLIFKTLCELCNSCSLVDKMSFEEGVGLLLSNYIVPVLEFEWTLLELEELKALCINFLSVLVSSNTRWAEIEERYFRAGKDNVNHRLLQVIELRRNAGNGRGLSEDRLVGEILNYFTRLSKKYFSVLFLRAQGGESIWSALEDNFLATVNHSYSEFVEEVFKGYFDELQLINSQSARQSQPSISQDALAAFLLKFIASYCQEVTVNNYLRLLSTLTYVDYDYWADPSFANAKAFLLHCFSSFVQEQQPQSHFPSIAPIKNNSLVRVALIKLLGYVSFCPEFQTEAIASQAVRTLLELSRQCKSLNSIVKITWGLSNWARTNVFARALSEQQLKESLDYMMRHSESDKEKIASNCTRGIGFFVANVGKQFDFAHCRRNIIKNMTHHVVKVRTNSTKTLLTLAGELTAAEAQELVPVLEQNILKNNYHLQMETLALLKKLEYPIKGGRLLKLYVSILKNLLNTTTVEYEFSEIKTIRQLRFTVLSEIFRSPQEINANIDLAPDILISVYAYLTRDCKEEQDQPENTQAIEKEFERTEEARAVVFNKGSELYNEEKVISTQLISKGFLVKANPEDAALIKKIKEYSAGPGSAIGPEWQQLAELKMDGSHIMIDFSALQLGEIYQEAKELLEP